MSWKKLGKGSDDGEDFWQERRQQEPAALGVPSIHVRQTSLDELDLAVSQAATTIQRDLLDFNAGELAEQITLLDLEAFVKISPEELHGCAWMRKDKFEKAPNVVAFTRRFNHTSFWVTREVLQASSAQLRASRISHFIKLCRKLQHINNFHGLLAVMSGLQSAPIYRLHQSWSQVKKESKQQFEQLKEIMSAQDNHHALREIMAAAKLPCIPHLAVWLMDIVHWSTSTPKPPHAASASAAGSSSEPPTPSALESPDQKIEDILGVIQHLQTSEYPFVINPAVRAYLMTVRYQEELQKLLEEENFKLSLQLEPRQSEEDTEAHREAAASMFGVYSTAFINKLANLSLQPKGSLPFRFKPPKRHGHRKSKSLTGTEFDGSRQHLFSNPAETSETLVVPKSSSPRMERMKMEASATALDESELSDASDEESAGHARINMNRPNTGFASVDFESPLYRRASNKVGDTLGRKKKQWAVLSGSTLHLYSSSKKADPMVPVAPCHSHPLAHAQVLESNSHACGFTLKLADSRTLRFIAANETVRNGWMAALRMAIERTVADGGHTLHKHSSSML